MSWLFLNKAAMFYIEKLYLYAIFEQGLEILVHNICSFTLKKVVPLCYIRAGT